MNPFDCLEVLETAPKRVSRQVLKRHSPWKLKGARQQAERQNLERNAEATIDIIAEIGMPSALEDLLHRQAGICLNTRRVVYL